MDSNETEYEHELMKSILVKIGLGIILLLGSIPFTFWTALTGSKLSAALSLACILFGGILIYSSLQDA